MHFVVHRDLSFSKPFCFSEKGSEGVRQKKSRQEESDVVREDLPAGGADDDSCLKLDLRGLDQPASPTTPRGTAYAVDSARTLADIPDDYLMSASARSTARDKLSEDAGPKLVSDTAEMPPSPRHASVISQSVGGNYSQDFSSVAATSQKPTQTDASKHSPEDSQVSEEIVETAEDISEAFSEHELSASAVKSAHEMSNLSASDRSASPSKSAATASVVTASVTASHVAGKYYDIIIIRPHHGTMYVDVVCCYRPSSVVFRSVCRSVCHSSEPCKNG